MRDKDAVDASFIICEMFAFYKTRGVSLLEKLEEIYKTCGYCLNTLYSYEFPGSSGMQKMQETMNGFHKGLETIAGAESRTCGGLQQRSERPAEVVCAQFLHKNGSVDTRPSGIEPKLKAYISVITGIKHRLKLKENRSSQMLKNTCEKERTV